MREHHQRVVLVGAGIAGLWALRRLLAQGHDAILLESGTIGGGQTLAAQGILHGGVKYGLDGSSRGIAEMLRGQPPVWLDSMAGRGEVDLTSAKVTSPVQHMWAADSWLARVGATVGARAMQGEVRKLDKPDWPAALRDGGHKGSVYELAETVVDTKTVVQALCQGAEDRILRADILKVEPGDETTRPALILSSAEAGELRLTADVLLFTAACGNEMAAEALGIGKSATQRRPLRMIMARGKLPPLWGHCVTVSPKPVVTVTTHAAADGQNVWYLGGGVAEGGTEGQPEASLTKARETMREVFPRLDWTGVAWATHDIDRAEPAAGAKLPEGPAIMTRGRAAIAWPAKMVYAPELARRICEFAAVHAAAGALQSPPPLPRAETGLFPWELAQNGFRP